MTRRGLVGFGDDGTAVWPLATPNPSHCLPSTVIQPSYPTAAISPDTERRTLPSSVAVHPYCWRTRTAVPPFRRENPGLLAASA
jgi:hypothetical protein